MAISPKLTTNRKKNPHHRRRHAFRDRPPVELANEDAVGLDELANLDQRGGREHLDSEDLHAARGGAGASADEHEQRKDRERERAPGREIGGGIAGAGQNRNAVEGGLAKRIGRRGAVGNHQPAGERKQGEQDQPEEPLHLRVPRERPPSAAHGLQIEHEGQRAQHHVDGGDPFDRIVAEMAKRIVRGREAAGGDGRHRVAHRLEGGHACGPIGEPVAEREREVDHADGAGELSRAGQHLLRAVRGFGVEELHPADSQHRQDRDRRDDDADAAEPLQERAPEQDSRRRLIEPDDDRGPGRREPRHRLEVGVGVAELEV